MKTPNNIALIDSLYFQLDLSNEVAYIGVIGSKQAATEFYNLSYNYSLTSGFLHSKNENFHFFLVEKDQWERRVKAFLQTVLPIESVAKAFLKIANSKRANFVEETDRRIKL